MAADSRLTITSKSGVPPTEKEISFQLSDATQKLFCTESGVGISTAGSATISGKPIAGHIEEFVLKHPQLKVNDTPKQLLAFFRGLDPKLATWFHVCGYDEGGQQKVFRVFVADESVTDMNPKGTQGAVWSGETDILSRLLTDYFICTADGKPGAKEILFPVLWAHLSLQDAIDFAVFAMDATIGASRFQNRIKTVGGPVDLLAIKAGGVTWVQKKVLRAK